MGRSAPSAKHEYGMRPVRALRTGAYDAAVVAVATASSASWARRACASSCKKNHVMYDIKHVFRASQTDGRL